VNWLLERDDGVIVAMLQCCSERKVTHMIKLYMPLADGWSSTMRVCAELRMLQLLQLAAVFFRHCNICKAASGGASRHFVTLVTLVTMLQHGKVDGCKWVYGRSSG